MKREIKSPKYSPAAICSWFGIARTTLFRWEEVGDISSAERGLKGERVYRQHHVEEIASKVKNKLKEEINYSVEYNPADDCPSPEILERLYKVNFFTSLNKEPELLELKELARKKRLMPATIRSLIEEAYHRPVGDKVRKGIWELLVILDSDFADR